MISLDILYNSIITYKNGTKKDIFNQWIRSNLKIFLRVFSLIFQRFYKLTKIFFYFLLTLYLVSGIMELQRKRNKLFWCFRYYPRTTIAIAPVVASVASWGCKTVWDKHYIIASCEGCIFKAFNWHCTMYFKSNCSLKT